MSNDQKRTELIQMVRQVQNASACVMDFDGMLSRLERKIGDPEIGRLIFDPPGGRSLTAEEIVDLVIQRRL